MNVILSPLGMLLAIVFAFSLAYVFRWMLNVSRQRPQEVAVARHAVTALQRILVPVSGEPATECAVELACRLGEKQKAEIILVYVVEVPFTLPLDAPEPFEEARGQEALRAARLIAVRHGLPVQAKILPHRYASAGILQLAEAEGVDAIVMSAGQPGAEAGLGRTSRDVLKRATCKVIIDRESAA